MKKIAYILPISLLTIGLVTVGTIEIVKANKVDNTPAYKEVEMGNTTFSPKEIVTSNIDTALASKPIYQKSDESDNKTSIRFIVAIYSEAYKKDSSITKVPDVSAAFTIMYTKVGDTPTQKISNASIAYTSITHNGNTIYPSNMNVGSYEYNLFLTYTVRDIPKEDYATDINFSVTVSNKDASTTINTNGAIYEAMIGDKYYSSLSAAISAVPTTKVDTAIKLLSDCNSTNTYEIVKNQYVTLDLNGHHIKSSNEICVKNNNSKLVIDDGSTNKDGSITGKYSAVTNYNTSANTTINAGKYYAKPINYSYGVIDSANGSVTINNGYFESYNTSWAVLRKGKGSITVNDGYFVGALIKRDGEVSEFVLEGGTYTYNIGSSSATSILTIGTGKKVEQNTTIPITYSVVDE